MTAVAVTADNNRVNAADSTTNWTNDGGGGGVANETDITYQNDIAQSRKVSTSRIGRQYDPGSGAIDTTAADRRHWMAKLNVTNPNALVARTTPGFGVKIGSSSSAYYEVYLYGAPPEYPKRGGWVLVPISVNVTGYRDATTGSPSLTAVDYWSVLADFSATSKAENVVIDAIDYGAGLHLVGGDGVDPDGTYQDFVDEDEGTNTNAWGYVFTQGSLILVNGRLAIGRNTSDTAVATVFTDSDRVLAWQNGWAETGFHRQLIDLGSASTVVTIDRCTFLSEGEDGNTVGGLITATAEDTRAIFEVVNNSGTLAMNTCTWRNHQDIILTSGATLTSCDLETEALTQASAEIDLCTIRTTSATSIATLQDPTFGASDLHDTAFVQAGAGHAIEIDTAGTYSFIGLTFTGYGADTTDSAALDITAGSGTVTINVSGGGDTPTYKTAGATVVINNTVTVTVTAQEPDGTAVASARVLLKAASGGALPVKETVSITRSGTTATATHTGHGLVTGNKVAIQYASDPLYNGVYTITVTGANTYTYTMSGTPAASPATVAPGFSNIVSTFVVLSGLTNGSGVISDSNFNYTAPQPVAGTAKKSTSAPFYKDGAINASIGANGLDTTATMVRDGS